MAKYTICRQLDEDGEIIYALDGVNYRNGLGLESAGWERERGHVADLKGTLTDREQLHLRGAIRLLRRTPSVGETTSNIADSLDGILERLSDA